MINVLPVNDLKEHTEDSTCDCKPTIEEVNGQIIVVHNAYDGRECVEMANEILNNSN